jgi:hypothetical protein
LVLENMNIQQPTTAGGCLADSVALSGGPGQCYRETGTAVTITSAALSSLVSFQPPPPPGQQAQPVQSALTISVAGRAWFLAGYSTRFAAREFEALLPSRSQALQLQRILVPSS